MKIPLSLKIDMNNLEKRIERTEYIVEKMMELKDITDEIEELKKQILDKISTR